MRARKYTKETIGQVGVTDRSFPEFKVGDTVDVGMYIKEGNKTRIQSFEGDVIAFHNNGNASTFTIRKIGANSVAVERILPYYSPAIATIKVVRHGDVRRAKLYYLRDKIGKGSRIKEKVRTREQKKQRQEAQSEAQ